MTETTIQNLFAAGAHLGHRPRYWNPQIAPYIYGKHNGIHIINLDKTLPLLKEALAFVQDLTFNGKTILFVGTKRAATLAIREQARRCEMPYVNHHWLGGTLTNYRTLLASINKYKELQDVVENKGLLGTMSKKDAQKMRRRYLKLRRNFEGIKEMGRHPDALFVIDVGYESIAVQEAVRLGIPLVAVVDTNNSTDGIDYVIPANDDSINSIKLCTSLFADAVIRGREEQQRQGVDVVGEADEAKQTVASLATPLIADTDDEADVRG